MAADDFEDENEEVHGLLYAESEREVEEGEEAEVHSVPERSNTEVADDNEVDMTSDEQEVNAVTAATVRDSLASM